MKRAILLLAAILVLVCGCLFWWRQPPSDAGLSAAETETAENATPLSVPPPAETNSVSKLPSLEKPVEFTDEEWRWALELRERSLAQNSPFVFHARVTDQHGQPVAGARLGLTLWRVDEDFFATTNFLHRPRGEERVRFQKELFSDAQGWFRLTEGTGTDLRIESLSKEGYLWNPPRVGIFGYADGAHQTSSAGEQAAFDPKQGFPLHLWKKGTTEAVVAVNLKIPTSPYGNTVYAVNLFSGLVSNGQPADLLFSMGAKTNAQGQPFREFKFNVPNGGLKEQTDPYPYRASDGLYPAAWEWIYDPVEARKDLHDTTALFRKRFYVRARGGRIVGAIEWDWPTGSQVTITGHLNPAGSPNLEPDPAKLITDEEEIRRLDEATRGR